MADNPYLAPLGQLSDKPLPTTGTASPTAGTTPKTWTGWDPTKNISVAEAQKNLTSQFGGDITPYLGQIQNTLAGAGYTDNTWTKDLSGDQYNALLQAAAGATGGTYQAYAAPPQMQGGPYQPGGTPIDPGMLKGEYEPPPKTPEQLAAEEAKRQALMGRDNTAALQTAAGTPPPVDPNVALNQVTGAFQQKFGRDMTEAEKQALVTNLGYQPGQPITQDMLSRATDLINQYSGTLPGGATPGAPAPAAPTPAAPAPIVQPTPVGGGPNLDAITPPQVKGQSWAGVDPGQTMSPTLAREGLQGYFGGDITPYTAQIQAVLAQHGYNDPTFTQNLTGAQYNALLSEGARLTGNTFTPYSTTGGAGAGGTTPGGTTTPPVVPPVGAAAPPPGTMGQPYTPGAPPAFYQQAPVLDVPEYQRGEDFKFDETKFKEDPGYRFALQEGQRAAENSASARGMTRGGNFMRDLVNYGQGMANQQYGAAFDRALQTHGVNQAEGRYAHERGVETAGLEYAPKLGNWARDRDEFQAERTRALSDSQRAAELEADRAWQKEVYGRDDAWRRHQYANEDAWRRYELEERRRLALAGGG